MGQRDLFQIVIVRTDRKLVEVIQVPAVQREGVANADSDEIPHGHIASEILSAEDDNRQQIAQRANDDEDERVDTEAPNDEILDVVQVTERRVRLGRRIIQIEILKRGQREVHGGEAVLFLASCESD